MKRINNEKGAALVLVLGIIMLIMIFTTVLAAQMTNTQQQINITDKTIDARNVARMGLDRAGKEIEEEFNNYEIKLNALEQTINNETKKEKIEAAKKVKEEHIKDFWKSLSQPKSCTENSPNVKRIALNHSYCIGDSETVGSMDENPWKVKLKATGRAPGKEIVETSIIEIKH